MATRSQQSISTMQRQAQQATTISEYRPHLENYDGKDPYRFETLFLNDLVQYKCSCGHYKRLNTTYFCRHCMALRCRSCVAHEVDSQYCQHCLEYIPTIDLKFQINKCASCYQCPSCQHLLSTSILSMSPSLTDQQPQDETVKRICQLICEFCRWSSETFVIEGSRITNNLADIEVPNASRISELMSFYKSMSQKEKIDKKTEDNKRRFPNRTNTMELLKKYENHITLSPRLISLLSKTNSNERSVSTARYNVVSRTNEELSIEAFKPAEPLETDELPKLNSDFYYRKDFDLDEISSIEQRLVQVELQPERVSNFKPISKSLSVKRSLRCKQCQRNLCRSEYSPISINFKIQSAAYYHIPELRLRSDVYPLKLTVNEYNIVEFTLQNQTLLNLKVKLDKTTEDDASSEIVLPPNELNLGPKDDSVDYEYVPLNMRPLNEETQVTFQGLFKVGFYIKVKPREKTNNHNIRFRMSHDILLLRDPKENDKTKRITHDVQVSLGSVN